MLPALVAGLGFGVLPDFLVTKALAKKTLEIVLPQWKLPAASLYWITPPGVLRPKRVVLLNMFLAEHFGP